MKKLIPEECEIVCGVVCGHFGLPVQRIYERSKVREIVLPRQVVFYLLHRLTNAALIPIGQAFGMDFGSVRYACSVVADAMSGSGLLWFSFIIKGLQ